jgi:ADP-ribose pyrophosphatase YjhB (NUDIX family)
MLVKVHALIWHRDQLVIHEERRQGALVRTLPGGRVLDRERLEVALRREVEEELGVRVLVGRLLYVAEVVHGHSVHDVVFVFAGEALTPATGRAALVDPVDGAGSVFPPILEHVATHGQAGPAAPKWLGNVWRSRE